MTAKKSPDKKKWKIIDVPFGRSLKTHATKLEKALNDLTGEGYNVQVTDVGKMGVIVVGNLRELAQQMEGMPVPMTMLRMVEGPPPAVDEMAPSERTVKLVTPLLKAIDATFAKTSTPDLKLVADAIIRKAPSEDIQKAIDELEKSAASHDNVSHGRKEATGCGYSVRLRKAGALLKERLTANLS